MPDRFTGPNVVEVAAQCEAAAKRASAAFTEAELLANSLEELTQAVVTDKVPQPILLDVQNHWIGNEVVQLPERRGATIGTMYRPDIGLPAREALKTSLHIPCSGTRQALTYRPSRMPTASPPEAVVTGPEVVVSVITDPSIAAQVRRHTPQFLMNKKHPHLLPRCLCGSCLHTGCMRSQDAPKASVRNVTPRQV